MFENWRGTIEINGVPYSTLNSNMILSGPIDIMLYPNKIKDIKKVEVEQTSTGEMQITVKSYMTKQSTPDFSFMLKWNNDIPMPLRTMVGVQIKETPGMVYMQLHGDITQEITPVCMRCGRPITNPVSQYFGMGPECGNHNYVNPFNSEEELKEKIGEYRKILKDMKWEGWIPKSAITSREEVYDTIGND